ncbi:MAG TPA: alpha-E domain-containing protein [Solirubrobacteraceae bacterium]|jgi:uncharacterized alpha-E superfamily protein|nr:alpha-E domain-containing protein [Solirubrobacteraceae bacterium]
MLARIAHELYWLGRNVARAEHSARMLDGIFLAELQGQPDAPAGVMLSWGSLLAIMGSSSPDASRERMLDTLALDPDQPTSVRASVTRAREGARTVRDVISAEMWESINTFHLDFDERTALDVGPYGLASYVKGRSALFWGVASRTMLRDEAFAFLEAGGRYESADMVLRMLRVALPPVREGDEDGSSPLRDGQALALLHAVGGVQAYRRAVPEPPNAVPVARFLLFTRSYPDSVAASVDAVRRALTAADADPRSSEPVLRLSRLSADLEFRGGGVAGAGDDLIEVCEIVERELAAADRDICERYFGGAAAAEHLVAHAP